MKILNEHTHHGYHAGAAPDVSTKANIKIWIYFIITGLVLFILIGALDVYFRFQVENERLKKIGEVPPVELQKKQQFEQEILSGKKGLFENKKHLSIEQAMRRFLSSQKASQ